MHKTPIESLLWRKLNKYGYFAMCPALQGCYSQGDTYEEALENIKDAIHLHLEDILESGEVIKKMNSFSLVALEVTA
jgi:predicted RNase H-like HicB family nuclease